VEVVLSWRDVPDMAKPSHSKLKDWWSDMPLDRRSGEFANLLYMYAAAVLGGRRGAFREAFPEAIFANEHFRTHFSGTRISESMSESILGSIC
jgi:hypothetical protein